MKTRIMSAIPLVAIFAGIALIATTTIPAAHAQVVTSTAIIIGVCGLVPTPIAIVYGSLTPNAESADQTVALTNAGNVQGTVSVRGSDWSGALSQQAMLVGATHYSLSSGQAYDAKTALTSTNAQLTTINPLATVNSYWQLKATLEDETTVGEVVQTVTFTSAC